MTLTFEETTKEMGAATSLHRNDAARQVGNERDHPLARHPPS